MPSHRVFADPTAATLPEAPGSGSAATDAFLTSEAVPSANPTSSPAHGPQNTLSRELDYTESSHGVDTSAPNPLSTASPSLSPSDQTPAAGQTHALYTDQLRGGVVPVIPAAHYQTAPSLSGNTLPSDSGAPGTLAHHATPASLLGDDWEANNTSSPGKSVNKVFKPDDGERVFLRNPLTRGGVDDSEDDDDSGSVSTDDGRNPDNVNEAPEAKDNVSVSPLSQQQLCMLDRQQKDAEEDEEAEDEYRKEISNSTLSSVEEREQEEDDAVWCRVSSLLAVAVLMCLGAIIVGLLGFLPFYFIGVTANGKTTEFLLAEAAKGVATITQNSVSMLPAFVHIIAFNFIKKQNTTASESTLPNDASELVLSLATVLTRFTGSIQSLSFILDQQLYAHASYTYMFQRSRAAYSDTPDVSPLWLLNESTGHFAEPLTADGTIDFGNVTTAPTGPMEYVVKRWANDPGNRNRWLHENMKTTSIYFNYVLPFSIDGVLGYCEAGLPSYNIMNETYKLVPALREHGRIVILDYYRGIVIENSWNQPSILVNTSSETRTFSGLPIDDINDDVMIAAIAAVKAKGGFAKIMENKATLLVEFKFKGNDASLNLTRLTDDYGLDILLGAAVVRADFEKAFATARSVVIGVTVGVVVLAAVIALAIAYVVVKPLKQLGPELQRASTLEISDDSKDGSGGFCGGIFITEIRDIEKAYRKLKRSLREMKSYVPQAMMTTAVDSGGSENGSGSPTSGRNAQGAVSGPKGDLRLNTKIFKEQINEFKKKSCTLVLIELRCTPDPDSVRAMIEVVTETVSRYSGCLEQIGLNHLIVSFGAHAPLPLHASKGCNFILDVYYRVPVNLREFLVCLVDSSEFMVGTCGARNRNSRVVFGVGHLVEITKVLWDIGCHVAATPTTSSHMPPVQSVPVECVQLLGSKSHTVLCELRPAPPAARMKQAASDCELLRDAFSHMCSGDYNLALVNYNAVSDKSSVQVQRLLRICQQRAAGGDRSNYVRPTEDVYHFAYRAEDKDSVAGSQLGSQPGSRGSGLRCDPSPATASAKDGPATGGGVGFAHEAFSKTDNSSFANGAAEVFPAPPAADDPMAAAEASTSCPLFDMFGNSTATSDDFQPGDRGKTADVELPLTLVDTDGHQWSRSINKISDGAFSVVYLGMSEDGVQVAIKCIPRRRRDIKEADIEEEIRVTSSLRHPNVVQYIAWCMTQTHLSIIMEYVPGGSLHAVIENFGKLNGTVVRRFMTDIVNGLAYLHSGNIAHCDVKPHNMLLGVNGVCKLSDFGSTVSAASDFAVSNSQDSNLRGTALYMAPEVARGEKASKQSDIFSLGVSVLEMLLGRLPWRWSSTAPANCKGESLEIYYHNDTRFVQLLSRGDIEVFVPDSLERDPNKFAKACCQLDPKKRPTAQDLLSNPFLL